MLDLNNCNGLTVFVLSLTQPQANVGIVKTTSNTQQELLMTVARHPRSPEVQGLSIEDIAQKYIRQFRDRRILRESK